MTKKYFNMGLVLCAAWTVYGFCQQDMFLRDAGMFVLIGSLLLRLKNGQKHFAVFGHIPLSVIIVTSFLAGLAWRSVTPPPEEALSPFPNFTAALQAGSVFASWIIWLQPFTLKNLYRLFFLAWLTVALSINVPFTNAVLMIFCAFCIIAIAIVILHTTPKPKERRHLLRYYRDFIGFSVVLIMITTGMFYVISRTIVIFDQAFMNLISDYVMPRNYTHFLRIEPLMKLGNPGRSAWDKRPVLEVQMAEYEGIYLKTQVFEHFSDGVWSERKEIEAAALSDRITEDLTPVRMTMFTSFEDIVPTPYSVVAAEGNMPLGKSRDGIVYTEDEQHTRILTFGLKSQRLPDLLSPDEHQAYTSLPPEIDRDLTEISSGIVGDETDVNVKADLIHAFFFDNFRYSLGVPFRADNEGLMKFLRERRPAYCTYFATGLALLLRAQKIPARVVTGFLVDEKIDKKRNIFLARVYDAHAWVEAYLPENDPETGTAFSRWVLMDATPVGERAKALEETWMNASKIAEHIWLSLLRFRAFMENLDKEKLKRNTLILLILWMLLINIKKILRGLRELAASLTKRASSIGEKRDPLRQIYRRYEKHLKAAFDETRKPHDTDRDVLRRLKARPRVPDETVARIESFVRLYHATRFGNKSDIDLERIIGQIEGTKKARSNAEV